MIAHSKVVKRKRTAAVRVVVLGGINTDYVVRGESLPLPGQTTQGEDLFVGPGGKGANQAVAAARLGAKVVLISCVGDEPRGRELVSGLAREKIDTRFITYHPKRPSGAAIIAVDAKGEKQISAAPGANSTLTVGAIRGAEEIIANADVLLMQFEVPMNCLLAAATIARKHGVKVVLDPAPPADAPKRLFRFIYAIRPNAGEAERMTGVRVQNRASARRAAAILLRKGAAVAAIQAGEDGDLVVSRDQEIFVPRIKVKAIDSTGAGDAFAAGFAVGIAEGMSVGEAARLANATAALSITKVGAQAGMPSRAAVDRLLRKRT